MNDTFKSIATALGSIAPTLATMLGGPLAGAAVTALEGAFNLAPGSGPDAITNVMQTGAMTPETIAAVRAADQKHAEIIGQQGIDLAKLNADHEASMAKIDTDDRDSARKREMDVKDRTPAHLAYMIIGGFFAVAIAQLVALMGWPEVAAKIPPQGWVIIGNISGYLAAEAKAAASYYFGSSSGSERKTELLAQADAVKQ
jgi:hypothetical protein